MDQIQGNVRHVRHSCFITQQTQRENQRTEIRSNLYKLLTVLDWVTLFRQVGNDLARQRRLQSTVADSQNLLQMPLPG